MPRCCVKDLPDQLELHGITEPKERPTDGNRRILVKGTWREPEISSLNMIKTQQHLERGYTGFWPYVKIMVPKGMLFLCMFFFDVRPEVYKPATNVG